jgi:thioredoxin 1
MKTIFYFTADWCNPCKKVKPIVEELNREQSDANFQIIDADIETELVKRFEIRSVPTFILMQDGVEINRIIGAQTRESLVGFIRGE